MCNFCLERSKVGSIKARDMIFVSKSISTRARKFNGIHIEKILRSCNHALHDNKFFFIDTPLNFPARVELLNTFFKLLCPKSEPGSQIEVCDYSTSSLSAALATLPP